MKDKVHVAPGAVFGRTFVERPNEGVRTQPALSANPKLAASRPPYRCGNASGIFTSSFLGSVDCALIAKEWTYEISKMDYSWSLLGCQRRDYSDKVLSSSLSSFQSRGSSLSQSLNHLEKLTPSAVWYPGRDDGFESSRRSVLISISPQTACSAVFCCFETTHCSYPKTMRKFHCFAARWMLPLRPSLEQGQSTQLHFKETNSTPNQVRCI